MIKIKNLLFASSNQSKIDEITRFVKPLGYNLISLYDLQKAGVLDNIDITEDGLSFEENALIKAQHLYDVLNLNDNHDLSGVLADDSGLVIRALSHTMVGRNVICTPGVFSARYASDHDSDENNRQILNNMSNVPDAERGCYSQCTVCYIDRFTDPVYFTGRKYGTIAHESVEGNGFAFDSIFTLPDGRNYGQLDDSERLNYSHRIDAMKQFLEYLKFI